MTQANWKSATTFQRFYKKPIQETSTSQEFASAILNIAWKPKKKKKKNKQTNKQKKKKKKEEIKKKKKIKMENKQTKTNIVYIVYSSFEHTLLIPYFSSTK